MFLSIMGMFEYDPDVFRGFKVPDGIDREACINNILLNCAELEIVYPNIDTMKLAISVWCVTNEYKWDKLYQTTKLIYNPIWNVDADITETDSGSASRNVQDARLIRSTDKSTNKETRDLTDTHSVKGFNSNSWSESDKDAYTGTDKFDYDNTTNVNDTLDTTENSSNNSQRVTRRTGNIGVTTTQQMIEQERNIAEFSMIEYITQSFKERFCLLIY